MASKNQNGGRRTGVEIPEEPKVYSGKTDVCPGCPRSAVPFKNGLCPYCGTPAKWADVELLRRAGVLDDE